MEKMMKALEIFWSFRSPYSHLATPRLVEIARRGDVAAKMRFVRPLALRERDFFERARPQWLPYLMRDMFREGQRLGIAIGPPRPDPVIMDLSTGKVAEAQPLMERLMALGVAAEEVGRGLAFAAEVSPAIWGGAENWHEGDTLADAAKRSGLDLGDMQRWAAANPAIVAERIAANEAAHVAHHWGVPLMTLDGEPFFGQDRIDALLWRLDQA
jgi:2-hydroxychromene-2-carboxylate isomerase